MALQTQLIHDESNSSQEVLSTADVVVDRQLSISETEFNRKWKVIEKALKKGRLGERFTHMSRNSTEKSSSKLEVVLFTKEGAGLTINLVAYGGGKNKRFYFGTRGSPTKLLSGQNLVELQEHRLISRIMKKLSCTEFEARSVCGFWVFQSGVRDELNESFFNEEERKRISAREVSVYSVGYATYERFGPNRDAIFDLLINMAAQPTLAQGRRIPLTEFLGVRAETYSTVSKREFRTARTTGLTLKKFSNGHPSYSQALYLKEEEVYAKETTISGRGNYAAMALLDTADSRDIRHELVRVDNVFYGPYLSQWLNAAYGLKTKPNMTWLKDIAPLFSNPVNIRVMIGAMRNELGLRTLLMAPTLERIVAMKDREESPLCKKTKALMADWCARTAILDIDRHDGTHRVEWDSMYTDRSPEDVKLLDALANKENLDLSLPFEFYTFLDEIRFAHTYSLEERVALSHEAIGFTDKELSKAHLAGPAREKAKKAVAANILFLRKNFLLPPRDSKKKLARTFILPEIKE